MSLGTAFPIATVNEARCSLCDVALGQQRRVWDCLGQSHQKIIGRRRNESLLGLAPRQILLPFYCYKGRGAEVSSRGWGRLDAVWGIWWHRGTLGTRVTGSPAAVRSRPRFASQYVPPSPKLDPCTGFRVIGVKTVNPNKGSESISTPWRAGSGRGMIRCVLSARVVQRTGVRPFSLPLRPDKSRILGGTAGF